MPALTRAWIGLNRLRRRTLRRRGAAPPREELVRRHAPGRSFVDVGCMWTVDGAIAFLAEESGASSVTGIDVMAASEHFETERARRGSRVRFVQGDIHEEATVAQAGVHDVVWCSGVLYHAPDPLATLRALRSLTGELLILSTEAIPELPGVEGGCIFYPALGEASRRDHSTVGAGNRVGLDTPFDSDQGFGNWWWGITPSALRGMLLATGFEVVEESIDPFHAVVVARPSS